MAVGRAPVSIAQWGWLGFEIEGFAELRGMEHGQRLVVVGIEAARGGRVVEQPRLRVNDLLQLAPRRESVEGEIGRQAQLGQAEAGLARIAQDEQRVVDFAQETRVLGGDEGAIRNRVGKRGEGGEVAALERSEAVHDGAVGGEEVNRVLEPLVIRGRCVPGERVVARRVVVLHRVVHGPDEGDLVHDLRGAREEGVDLDAIGAGGHRLVQAADALGRVGLHVESLEVARPAPLEEEDDGLRAGGWVLRGLGLGGEELG